MSWCRTDSLAPCSASAIDAFPRERVSDATPSRLACDAQHADGRRIRIFDLAEGLQSIDQGNAANELTLELSYEDVTLSDPAANIL